MKQAEIIQLVIGLCYAKDIQQIPPKGSWKDFPAHRPNTILNTMLDIKRGYRFRIKPEAKSKARSNKE
jgi:hypothetical protein